MVVHVCKNTVMLTEFKIQLLIHSLTVIPVLKGLHYSFWLLIYNGFSMQLVVAFSNTVCRLHPRVFRDSVCRTVQGWIKLYTFGESLPLDFLNLSFSFLWEGRFQKSEATQTCPPWTSLIIRNCRGSFKSGFWDKHLLLLPAFPCSFGGLFCAWRSRNQTWGWLLCVWANQQWGVWLLSFADEWSNRETPRSD